MRFRMKRLDNNLFSINYSLNLMHSCFQRNIYEHDKMVLKFM